MARRSGDESLLIRFFLIAERNEARSEATGRAEFDEVECVSIQLPGARDEVVKVVDAETKDRFGSEYKEWKAYMAAPISGTPLDEWPAAGRTFVEQCRLAGIRSVEDLANLDDMKIGEDRDLQAMRAKAQAYVAVGDVNIRVTELEADNAKLRARVAELEADAAKKPVKTKPPEPAPDPATMTDEELEAATAP